MAVNGLSDRASRLPSASRLDPLIFNASQHMRKAPFIVAILVPMHLPAGAGAHGNWIQVRNGTWTVSRSDIAQMAKQLQSAAAAARGGEKAAKDVSTYAIQFKGVGPAGHRVIELRGACEAEGHSLAELRKDFRSVLDGGECYFSATWDAAGKKFEHFLFNGVA